jgi:hypothetical protein
MVGAVQKYEIHIQTSDLVMETTVKSYLLHILTKYCSPTCHHFSYKEKFCLFSVVSQQGVPQGTFLETVFSSYPKGENKKGRFEEQYMMPV